MVVKTDVSVSVYDKEQEEKGVVLHLDNDVYGFLPVGFIQSLFSIYIRSNSCLYVGKTGERPSFSLQSTGASLHGGNSCERSRYSGYHSSRNLQYVMNSNHT